MKRETLKELLGEAATDELVDAIMAANGKDVNAAKSGIDALKQQLAEANAKVSELTDAANSTLSDTEKLQRAVETATAERDKAIHALNEQSAVAVFAGAGLSEEDYKQFLGAIVTTDQKATRANAQAIADLVSAKVAAAKEQSGKQSLAGMKGPEPGSPAGQVTTKADFMKLPYDQQRTMLQSNPQLISQLQ